MERAYWLAWSTIPRIGSVLLKRIYQRFGSLATAWQASGQELAEVEGLGSQTIEGIISSRSKIDPRELIDLHTVKNPHFWTPADSKYPQLLWEIPDPPPVLYYQGNIQTWAEESAIAIIGTRNPSSYGRKWAKKIARALAESGFVVVSGLAEGIDAESHHSCLEVGGTTLAVVGTGVDRIYPPKHLQLYQEVQRSGLVISEYPQGTGPEKSHFPQRNRIIAGLCRASIVIEAPSRSGALITAHQANEYGRDVYALPGSLDIEQAHGCLQLINRGAQVILGIDELLESLGAMPQLDIGIDLNLHSESNAQKLTKKGSSKKTAIATPELDLSTLDPFQQKIMQVLSFDELKSLDRLVLESGLTSSEVSLALLQLEMNGAIAQSAGMRYSRLL
ncbi:DNA protecting protein DprA [Synechococcus sp. PCC 7502]|uniref:DNA-processing protein DprA n=1 Tax=Synechococcus sp. PCC 7502 TaxID=1173263 RepID=UPI00029FE5BE|nr:DNA-processing protein DprA [Synechococcus sp. PCC 7502]AFY74922.1 DNA protecting protein DprA [Synechococcus sp. PCC 7502]